MEFMKCILDMFNSEAKIYLDWMLNNQDAFNEEARLVIAALLALAED